MYRIILVFGGLLQLISCKSTNLYQDENFSIKNDSINLYAFIGEKISIIEFDPNINSKKEIAIDQTTGDSAVVESYVMDNAFKVKYKVLKNIFNEFTVDTVDFVAYDHYGRPKFENYQYVILYLSLDKEDGNYYHQKYQFDPVKKTSKGNWEGKNGESIKELFENKKNGVFKAREVFK